MFHDGPGDERKPSGATPESPGVGRMTGLSPSIPIAVVRWPPLEEDVASSVDPLGDKADPSVLDPDGRPTRPRRDLL